MATLTTTRNYLNGELLLDTDFNAFLDDIEHFLNDTKVNDANIQDGGINAALKLANATLTTDKMGIAVVTTEKLATDAITTSKIESINPGLGVYGVTREKIANLAITDAKIANEAITSVKLASDIIPAIRPLTAVTFATAGTASWTVPANICQLRIEGCGGGGGGGGGGGTADWNSGFAPPIGSPKPAIGGGGGGSSYLMSTIVNVTPGQILSIVVGSGGAGGGGGTASSNVNTTASNPNSTLGANGANGGDSTVSIVGVGTIATFSGGAGGAGGRAFAYGYEATPSAAGGTYEASGGGAPVVSIPSLTIYGGAGGGSIACGPQGDGEALYTLSGYQGQTVGGDAIGGVGGNSTSALGYAGQGGGGGGGAGWRNTGEGNGGQGRDGASGRIRIWY